MAHAVAGWHSRATAFQGSFRPASADIVFIALISLLAERDGFTLALVEPNLAVDARGKVLILGAEDFASIRALARATKELPKPDALQGMWRVKHLVTCRPIDTLMVTGQAGVSVYGWDEGNDLLKDSVGGLTKLPEDLQTLFGWIREARDGYVRGNRDVEPIQKVRAAFESPESQGLE